MTCMVLSNVDESELSGLARTLVRIPSETGNEEKVARFLESYLRDLGYEVHSHEGAPRRPNIVAIWRGAEGHPRIMLTSHLDTMPVGDIETWSVDPYGGE